MVRNEVLNSKKYIHKPSPRMDLFKLNNGTKFISFSKDTKLLEQQFIQNKTDTAAAGNMFTNSNITNNTNNSNNNIKTIVKNTDAGIIANNPIKENFNLTMNVNNNPNNLHNNDLSNNPSNTSNNIQGNNTKTNRGQITLRKSIEFNKVKLNDDLLKKSGQAKSILFKNLNKNTISNNLNAVKLRRNDSGATGISGLSGNIKTNENNLN
jgi:hypothetical protein